MSNFRLAKPLNSWVGTMSSASGLNEAVRCIYDVQSTNLTDRRVENTRVVFFFLTRLETDKTVRRRIRFRFTAPAKHLQKKKTHSAADEKFTKLTVGLGAQKSTEKEIL